MQIDKALLILAGFLALFVIYYFTGWVCDSKFRLVMRKTKLSSFKKILFHFKGSKTKEDRGHAIICVKLETFSFVNVVFGILCFAAVKITGNTLVFLACGALGALSFAFYAFQMYMNIGKYKDRKKQLDEMDETGFAEYREKENPVSVTDTAEKKVSQPTMAASRSDSSDGNISSMENGREILRNKGLLDDDIFFSSVLDVSDKFTSVKAKESFADGSDIEKGKAALENFAGKQLNTEAFFKTARFEDAKNSYESAPAVKPDDKSETESARDIIDRHRDDINPENQFKSVNNYSPVRKDDKQ